MSKRFIPTRSSPIEPRARGGDGDTLPPPAQYRRLDAVSAMRRKLEL